MIFHMCRFALTYSRTVAFVVLILFANPLMAQELYEVQKLTPDFASNYSQFGYEQAMEDGIVVIGGDAYASIYLKTGSAWNKHQDLVPDNYPHQQFARYAGSVDLSNGTIVIGDTSYISPGESTNDGGVYVFTKTSETWSKQDVLEDGQIGRVGFGRAVAIDADTAIVGATQYNGSLGAVYVFSRTGDVWTQEAILTRSGGSTSDYFGGSLDIEGDTAVVGGEYNSVPINRAGSAYVYKRENGVWTEEATLVPSNVSERQHFGGQVKIVNGIIAVAAMGFEDWKGAVYIFEKLNGVWTETQRLTPKDPVFDHYFGERFAFDGETLVIGAQGDGDNGLWSGAAWVFKKQAGIWTEVFKLKASDGEADDWFGYGQSVFGSEAFVAAGGDDDLAVDSGAAYLFDISNNVTPIGQDVVVLPPSEDLNGDPIENAASISFAFEDIDSSGDTTITVVDPSPTTTTPPQGFSILGMDDSSALFDFHTTAELAAGTTVEICIDYSGMDIAGDPADLVFAHEVDGVWQDITSSNDLGNETICGITDSFSYFALLEVADPVQLLSGLMAAVQTINAKNGILNSLDAKLDAAESALSDAKANNDHSAMNVLMDAFINHVEAQRGQHISTEEADKLINLALEIVAVIEGGLAL